MPPKMSPQVDRRRRSRRRGRCRSREVVAAAAAAAGALHALDLVGVLPVVAVLVVLLALLGVGEHVVGGVDLLEAASEALSLGLTSGWCLRASLR